MQKNRAAAAEGILEGLQRNSWQLELLITGFALAAMVSGLDPFTDWTNRTLAALGRNDTVSIVAGGVVVCASFAYVITLFNFFIHVVLRCLWIGAIGSRSVMGTTVVVRRPLAPKFSRFLRDRVGHFDDYILRLDDAASLVFAFTFLLISTALSLVTTTLAFSVITYALGLADGGSPAAIIWLGLFFLLTISALVYLVDFLSGGYLKRFGWFSRVYFPVYRFFGWITLARLYRPLYYNLLNRRGGRYLVTLVIPYGILCIALLTLSLEPNKYVAGEYFTMDVNGGFVVNPDHYAENDSGTSADGELIIPALIIRDSPLPVTIPLLGSYESYIRRRCPNLPQQYASSVRSRIFDRSEGGTYTNGTWSPGQKTVLNREILSCLGSATELYLDGRKVEMHDVLLGKSENDSRARLIKFIALDSLSPGLHELQLRQLQPPRKRAPLDTLLSVVTVPFYFAPD